MRQKRSLSTAMGLVFGVVLALGISAHARETEEFHKTYPLNADGTFALTNVNGQVQIKGWDQNSVQVDAVKYADDKEYLQELRINVSSSPAAITIDTKYPEHMSNHEARVEYTVSIPRGARIRKLDLVNGKLTIEGVRGDITASSVNGTVEITGAAGELRLDSVNGKVNASVAQLGRSVKLSCVNGTLNLTLPSDVNANVKASTVNGNISNDFGASVEHARYGPGASLDAQLGSGANDIHMSTVNGSIHLLRASDGKTASKVTQKRKNSDGYY